MRTFTVKNKKGQAFEVDEDKISEAEKDDFLPVVTNGQQEHRVSFSDLDKAEKDGYKPIFKSSEEQPTSSNVGDFLRGGVQSATLGGSDELVGALKSTKDLLSSDEGFTNFAKNYRKYQQEEQKANQEAKARSPFLYTGGELVGGLVPGVVGAGILPAAEGAALGARAFNSALTGAGAGMVAAPLSSESNIEDVGLGGKLTESAEGGLLGGILGAGATYGLDKAGGALKSLKKSSKIEKIAEAFDIGKEGKLLSNKDDVAAITDEFIKFGQNTSDDITNVLKNNLKQKTDLLKKSGKTFNFDSILKETIDEVDQAFKDGVVSRTKAEEIKDFIRENLYKEVPKKVKKQFQTETSKKFIKLPNGEIIEGSPQTTFKGKGMSLDELAALAEESPENLNPLRSKITPKSTKIAEGADIFEDIPGIQQGEVGPEEAINFVRRMQASGFRKGGDEDLKLFAKRIAAKSSDLIEEGVPETAPLNKTSTSSLNLFDKIGKPETVFGMEGGVKEVVSPEFLDIIKGAQKITDPAKRNELKKIVNPYLEQVFGKEKASKIMEGIEKQSLRNKITTEGGFNNLVEAKERPLTQIIGSSPEKMSNYAGYATQSFPVKALTSVSKTLSNLPFKGIERVAEILETNPSMKNISSILRKGLEDKDQSKINAGIFLLLQNPNGRNLVTPFLRDEENK